MDGIEPLEVQIPAVHYIERTRFRNEQVQDVDIMCSSFGNVDKFRDTAAQIQKSMKLDGSLVVAEPRPGKELQTQVDGGRIECIGRLLQLNTKVVVEIKRSGYLNQYLGKISVNAPISGFVGIGQGAARYVAPDTHVV